jgi:hypothetical protein
MIEISDEYMSPTVNDRAIATARFSQHAASDERGAWGCLIPRADDSRLRLLRKMPQD